ncbi:MAG: sigma-54-dependent Fis family transcriptional regulator [Fuerstiella sp.]|nr:sigma-54-dependent Fis family transcriptional regulator [Fuerstiella sp.]MCP4512681.1 sigma-54-dependent Fis family transcriptional regulator [Fuerstiella sp.]
MAIRRKRNLLDATLVGSTSAICVLDAERRIRFFSPGLQKKTGWTADDMEGLICEFAADSSTPKDLLISTLAPSHEVLNGAGRSVQTVLPHSNGTSSKTGLTFLPIHDSGDVVTRIIIACSEAEADSSKRSLSLQLHAEVTALRLEFRKRFSGESFVGQSPAITTALDQAELLKHSTCGYSIVGPSGSGRRHLSRMIHTASEYQEHSFVALNSHLLTEVQLLDTLRRLRELVDEKGSAAHRRTGTLMLVDADRCPREVQQWLLENLADEATGVRLGAISLKSLNAPDSVDWLIPEFRDLFSTLQIELPGLHERGEDISLLAQFFIEECRHSMQTSAESMTAATQQELLFYRWPGNVRELRQVMFDACQNCFSNQLCPEDLPFAFRAGVGAQEMPATPTAGTSSLESILERFELEVLLKTLAACDGNKAEAARRLGMTRPKLYRRLKTLGINSA